MQGTLTGIMFLLLFFPKVNDTSCAIGSLAGIVCSFITMNIFTDINWMWCYLYSTVFSMVFSIILSMFIL